MSETVFAKLADYYIGVVEELTHQAKQAGLLTNSTDVGTEKEEVYRRFLERHAPSRCEAFLGGYLFDIEGNRSKQIDVIVTAGSSPRFEMGLGNQAIAPLEGTIAIAQVKSNLNKRTLIDALNNLASIPSLRDFNGVLAPYLKHFDD